MSNAANLVLNGGFETGDLTDWTVTDAEPQNPDIGVDSQPLDVNTGSYGLFAGNETTTLSQTIATTVGHDYTVSFFLDVYQSQAFNGGVQATFGGQSVVNLVEPAETDAFVQYTANIVATSDSSALQFTFTDPGGYFGLDDVSVTDETNCYCSGTRIRTPDGDLAVETLRRGDLVLTHDGRATPIVWLGLQTVSTRFADPLRVFPIRIKAGALAPNVPSRDLRISPDHAVLVDGALIHASALVNGASIVREIHVPEVFTYYHVETEAHELIFAEDTPAETFVDNVDRLHFDNWAVHEALYPQGKPIDELPYPRAKSHRQVSRFTRAKLAERARAFNSFKNAVAS